MVDDRNKLAPGRGVMGSTRGGGPRNKQPPHAVNNCDKDSCTQRDTTCITWNSPLLRIKDL